MNFYEQLSIYYDEIFHTSAQEMQFLTDYVKDAKVILDIGCGTGNKTELFSKSGNKIFAFDVDAEMIKNALAKHSQSNITYEVLDMRDMARHFADSHFDATLCLGNTLVHLDSKETISKFIQDCYNLLNDKGLSIFQILNYDYILDNKIEELPSLEGPNTLFLRTYKHRTYGLDFITRLTIKQTGESFEHTIILQPLRPGELRQMLLNAGFASVDFFGGFKGEPLEKDSLPLIAICKKQIPEKT